MNISKLSFRNKLKSAFLVISILSILITGLFSYTTTARILEDKALTLTQDTVAKSAQVVDEKLNNLMIVMMTFMISNSFQTMLKDAASGNTNAYFTHLSNMDNVFSQARIAEPLIQSIYISTPIGDFYPLSMNLNRSVAFKDTALYARAAKAKRNIWIEGHEDPLFKGNPRVVSLILLPIAEFSTRDVYVVVNIRESGLRQIVGSPASSGSERFLLNADGGLVYADDDPLAGQTAHSGRASAFLKSEAEAGYTTVRLGRADYLLNYARLGLNDWTIVAVQSKSEVLKDLDAVKWAILLITALSFFVTFLLSGWFTRYLLRPLKGLQLVMKRVEGNDLTARFESDREDDLAQVGYRFNRMLEQIVVLIDEVKAAEASKRNAEIKSLSAQMDPHFLYNTLNTIYWKLNLGQIEPSQRMVVALSRLFQLGLNKGREMTTLDKELDHVRKYLELQSWCYENLFDFAMDVEDGALLARSVPRLILQPLVENAILHGFKDMEEGGRIVIEVRRDPGGEAWILEVRDNGRGMDAVDVKQLSRAEGESGGYALDNLVSRLQLVYGDEARLSIESAPDSGTKIALRIPLRGESSDERR
ncbi:sensor histidine kinase [Cohnella ginsengisoli]|uniref:Sensor histidine kinase n=1 Tax=Cohnella ginsengisoli TaxID=425004 RepID=A0A9X4KID2_9BACL|nr:sensor histidine kinase [Cohnella ginsengisoli]MDG0792084.1 sensor histidine kinase [Cohnella ginsengisoli]